MKRIFIILAWLIAAIPAPGRGAEAWLVQTSEPKKIQSLTDQAGLELVHAYRHFPWALYRTSASGLAGLKPDDARALLGQAGIRTQADTPVRLADYPVPVIPNDPRFISDQTQLSSPVPEADIHLTEAWSLCTDASDVTVAVIDSGIDLYHPDLTDILWTNTLEQIGLYGVDDDGNGKIDDLHGWNMVANNDDIHDEWNHGTEVAGLLGAKGNNGVGIAGVCWRSSLMIVKAFESDIGSTTNLLDSLDYVMDFPEVRIVNASWGYTGANAALESAMQALADRNILVVAAAGNGNGITGVDLDTHPFYPASYPFANIVSVAAIDDAGSLAGFSNYGSQVSLAAPGDPVFTTNIGASYISDYGTSFAVPLVSGAAALLLANRPSLSAVELKTALIDSSTLTTPLAGVKLQGGLLNVYNLLNNNIITAVDGRLWRLYAR